MVKKIEVQEKNELRWPDGINRTYIKLRKPQNAWKKATWKGGVEKVGLELSRMGEGATSVLICRSPDERTDPGVAVWWTMRKEDFSWQQVLGLENPAPTFAQIDSAFRDKAKGVHPDRSDGGDPEAFMRLNKARDAAKAWISGTHAHAHEFVMAIDQYTEARLNLNALRLAFSYIRGLERVGAPSILTQTLGAFRAKLVATTGGSNESPSA